MYRILVDEFCNVFEVLTKILIYIWVLGACVCLGKQFLEGLLHVLYVQFDGLNVSFVDLLLDLQVFLSHFRVWDLLGVLLIIGNFVLLQIFEGLRNKFVVVQTEWGQVDHVFENLLSLSFELILRDMWYFTIILSIQDGLTMPHRPRLLRLIQQMSRLVSNNKISIRNSQYHRSTLKEQCHFKQFLPIYKLIQIIIRKQTFTIILK